MKREEDQIQIAFMTWVHLIYPKFRNFIFHVPNGGKMSIWTGKRLKLMGVKSGVADVLFMFSNKNFHGLWLEFKSSNGKQTETQKEFENTCKVANYAYKVVKSIDEAIKEFDNYIGNINGKFK